MLQHGVHCCRRAPVPHYNAIIIAQVEGSDIIINAVLAWLGVAVAQQEQHVHAT